MERRISLKDAIELTEHVLDCAQEAIEPLEALHKAFERAERFFVPWVDPNYKHVIAKQLEYMRGEQNQSAVVLHHLQCKREAVFARHKAQKRAESTASPEAVQLTAAERNGDALGVEAPIEAEPVTAESAPKPRQHNAQGKKARKTAAAQR